MSSTTAATTTTTKVYTNLTAAETTLHGGQEIALPVFPQPPTFTDKVEEREYLKGRLALAFRLFAKFGFDEGVAGHITLRDPVRPDHFWVNPLGRAFAQMRRSDLILVNGTGEVVDGGPNRLLNKAAYMIHHAVHAARPDVHCAAHAHSLYGRAFCALGKPLAMLTQDSCAFYQSVALYQQFNGVVLDAAEGANIARALGAGKACLLQNHGLLTVGATVEAAVFWFASLDKCCHVQLLAEAASHHEHAKTIDEADVAFTAKSVGNPTIGWFSAQPMFDVLMEEIGDAYLQ
ncbi:hypothetical protein HMPREF1624_02564 [Sporothrix schenckii ATCC 58251]|uniref:Class II aldolase/adducin N-terminal domain-containing protein n=1 Tax=Sporothrix schenckii (strain ATCC 58251 / de Perez 2211183) TaxID=1391915 RepID=U7Q2T2_SPOS1|nr:hypothetical protein HMPREF1624_02564 [Sporothrix schenckii ATCC 58251]